MHDIVTLEGSGVVAAFVASSEFVTASRAQAAALGYGDSADGGGLRGVFVPHPIQDRTDDEMHALASNAVDDILAAVTSR